MIPSLTLDWLPALRPLVPAVALVPWVLLREAGR
jgi:hypothetical protein